MTTMQYKHLFLTITFLLSLLLASFAQEPILLEHSGGVRTVEFSPADSQLVASAGESNIIKLWNLQNDTVRTLRGHTDTVNSIAFSPNGELLVSVSDDRTIRLWNVHTQQNMMTLQDGTPYRSVAFSPDGRMFATAGGHHVTIWDLPNWTEIARIDHNRAVRVVAFSSDGQLLAVGENVGEGPASVKVWDVQRQQVVVRLTANPKSVKSIKFSFDNRYMAASGWNGHLKVWGVSNWELLHTIPNIGHYDIAFSPDGKMLAGTNGNGYVSLWWVEDGTRVARLPGPTEYRHPVDFSLDGAYLAVGAEDGLLRIWQVDTSLEGQNTGGIRILHVDTYHQQLRTAKSATMNNIPDPVPPPVIVREYFQLDPFYKQWINVGGLPVIASAKVNPYALKEAAWLILKMIGHRPDVLRAMVENSARFSVIAHTEIITEIPEYRSDPRPDFLVFRERGWGGTEGGTISTSEEDILNYPGSFAIRYEALLHELAHGIHILGLNTLDPTFDDRLRVTYEAAIKKGLWQGTYASVDRREYWAEATHAWFYPNGTGSFDRFGNTRQALKEYDPELATLLAEVYGDKDWQYTPVETRTHQPHLSGFNPQNSPIFDGWPELAALYQQLRTDPSSDGGGEWVNLDPYKPNQLSRLTQSNVLGDLTTIAFVNFTQADVLLYEVTSAGTEQYWSRCAPGRTRGRPTRINSIWLVKNTNGGNIAVFQAEEKIGRAAIGATTNKRSQTTQVLPPKATEPVPSVDVNSDGIVNILDLVFVSANFGKTGQNAADVNGDGIVNIVDLVRVAGAMGTGGAAPSAQQQTLEGLTATDVKHWLLQAQHLDLTDATSQRGILMLQQLLAALIPKETSLLPNYPNPFNPETWVPYQLSEPAAVTLHIYAVDGRLVRTLALGHQPAGIYQSKNRAAYWDGRNQVGEPVASSVYFYTLTAGEFTATRKMLIMK